MASLDLRLTAAVERPFPGLRSFEPHESFLFFGRRQQTGDLLERLSSQRLVAIVGGSGSGKSSLVRAGVIPELHRGHLAGAGSRWRIAIMRPGDSPMDSLAHAVSAPDVFVGDASAARRVLAESTLGLLHLVRTKRLRANENFLLLVDQFEELFRYRTRDRGEEASLFVQSLLQATDQLSVPVFVLLTMRSDFLGSCDRFRGLPERLSRSQYLIPRLVREQRREAIEMPLRLAGLDVAPDLLQRLLNDVGDDPDQLPVLQHALMRTFLCWKESGRSGTIRMADYEKAGGLDDALDRHARALFDALPSDEHRRWAQRVFRALTTLENGVPVRRPQPLGPLYAVTGASTPGPQGIVRDVLATFSAEENSMVTFTRGAVGRPESVVDISHESLIRKWADLDEWVREEGRSVEYYRYANRDAALHREDKASLWRRPALDVALLYLEEQWNEAWAAECTDARRTSFADTAAFLRLSRDVEDAMVAREEERRRQELETARRMAQTQARAKRWARGAAALLLLLLVGTLLSVWIIYREQKQRIDAEAKVVDLTTQQEEALARELATRRQIAQLEAKKTEAAGRASSAALSPAEQARLDRLRSELDALQKEKADLATQVGAARSQVQQTGTKDTEATRLIATLQDQLQKVRQERDEAVKKVEAGSASDGELLLTRARTAEARVKQLEGELGAAMAGPPLPAEPTGVLKNLEWHQSYEEGRKALENGRLPEAVFYLRRALEVAENEGRDKPYLTRTIPYYVPHYYLALAYLGHGNLDEACASAREAEKSGVARQKEELRAPLAAVVAHCRRRAPRAQKE